MLAAAIPVVATIVITWWPKDDAPACASPPCGESIGVDVKIVNTWEASQQRLIGVNFYPSPHSNARTDADGSAAEGAIARVVCQERHGRLVKDTPYGTRPTRSTVWNKTNTGRYFSDIYSDLPKVDGDTPPRGLPNC
ncbi:hypothetical protein [Micromonospora sp. NPDC005305]|uniref:hypothetical protein n=1 Tax=Micromonospora sp. NPDC005305 TaxID=3156875 RepID=UPI0033A61878